MLHLDRDADQLEHAHHLRAQVLELVHGRDGEVALLVPRLVREVRPAVELALAARVPHAFDRVEEVVARVLVLVEAHGVEDVELRLRSEVRGVGETGRREVRLRLRDDVARVAAVRLTRQRVAHEAVDVERRVLPERVEHRGARIRDQEHVGLLDLLEPADRRAVEAEPVLEYVLGELVRGDREVLHQPREVAEPDIDHIDAVVLDELQDVAGRAVFHGATPFVSSLIERGRERAPRSLARRSPVCSCSLVHYVSVLAAAHRLGDETRHDVRVHVGVRATVLDVALLVDLDLPRDAHRRATVRDAVAELVPRARSRAYR